MHEHVPLIRVLRRREKGLAGEPDDRLNVSPAGANGEPDAQDGKNNSPLFQIRCKKQLFLREEEGKEAGEKADDFHQQRGREGGREGGAR